MAKTVAEWRKIHDDWKKILSEPKNLGLKAGGTGLGAAILKVGDGEQDVAQSKAGGKLSLTEGYADLSAALTQVITICKATSDKHKKLFTSACAFVDTHIKAAAEHRKGELQAELAEARKAVVAALTPSMKQMTDAADIHAFATAWEAFVAALEAHQLNFPHLKPFVTKAKGQHAPAGDLGTAKPAYSKIANECKNAASAMA